ncbi:MAG: UDP-N-acetylmuramate--L-alanine ligase, partial [Chitinophagaceae bacterium]|nr:UDP-N-acetylmuramate--L-alanine ligase [Chitinophagaceae bacterium]
GITLNMGGMHNVENAIAAITVAQQLGIEEEKIQAAVADFKGVKRRFEYIIKKDKLIFIDDYAHHPEELTALIRGARTLFGGKRCTVIFQPHLFSRTRDFAKGFAESLDLADSVILLPIYPARELPMFGVTSELIAGQMHKADIRVLSKEDVIRYVKDNFLSSMHEDFGEVIITAGAGDIDTLVHPLKELLNR